jgi:hypothetical protein
VLESGEKSCIGVTIYCRSDGTSNMVNPAYRQRWQEITSGEAVSLVSWEARLRDRICNSSAKIRSHLRAPLCQEHDLALAYSATSPTLQSIIKYLHRNSNIRFSMDASQEYGITGIFLPCAFLATGGTGCDPRPRAPLLYRKSESVGKPA